MTWHLGDRLRHRFNRELGPGVVTALDARMLTVRFPRTGTSLRLAVTSDALRPLELRPGARVRVDGSTATTLLERIEPDGQARLADGRTMPLATVWPIDDGGELIDRLAAGEVDSQEAFRLRLDALRLAELRETGGLGSFLGGRVRLFPHQLHVAERATATDPVRWLLADEVGLGKTVESCLILNHLLATRRAESALVIAPETLTVQWLGELWRKYHQVFALVDEDRLTDIAKVYGEDFNPFDTHQRAVVSQRLLVERPELAAQAVEADLDLVIVDEAHHLRRPAGHPGDPTYRAVAPIVAAARHALLLTAVPLEDDLHGFFRLLELLRPADFPDFDAFERQLAAGIALPPCTSATRRSDIGGLPPRVGVAVDLPADAGWTAHRAALDAVRRLPADDAVAARRRLALLRRGLAYPGHLATPALPAATSSLRTPEVQSLVTTATREDPRLAWLVRQARHWAEDADKTLVFVAERDALEAVRAALGQYGGVRTGGFHEGLSSKQRDIEVAQFRLADGPSVLVSTECGGEGRNFEFCRRLVLFDLPWNPLVAEQRIGRLDRIGRRLPVEVVYFRPPTGIGATVAALYEQLGLFEHPLTSYELELEGVEPAIEELAALADDAIPADAFRDILEAARAAYDRVQRAAYHELHRDPFRPELAAPILARIPADLEELTRGVVLGACDLLGLVVGQHRDGRRCSIELDARARVESLPGIPGEASFLGTFSRENAVADETIDFFATGHPLVEGLLAHLADDPLGRVALLRTPVPPPSPDGAAVEPGFGLLAIYRHGTGWRAVAVDRQGGERPEWAALFTAPSPPLRRVRTDEWVRQPAWPTLVRTLATRLERHGPPLALAAIRVG